MFSSNDNGWYPPLAKGNVFLQYLHPFLTARVRVVIFDSLMCLFLFYVNLFEPVLVQYI